MLRLLTSLPSRLKKSVAWLSRRQAFPFMSTLHPLKVFSGRAKIQLAERIAQCLGDPLGKITLVNFPDGEFLARIHEDVRGRDVFVVQPTCQPVNENLMELLIILDSLRRASP